MIDNMNVLHVDDTWELVPLSLGKFCCLLSLGLRNQSWSK